MEDEFVDIVDTTTPTSSLQSPEKVEKKPDNNNSTPPAPIRRSTRIRPQIPTYAQLRRRSTSPSTPPRKASKSNQKAKRGENGSAPKLKLRLGERSHLNTSFLGPWDRELDSDDEDLAFEEQFILRMPEDEDADQLRQMVAARDVKDDVWFKFTDSRRGIFHMSDKLYNAKLVDLPSIIEAQKTLDNRQMFKIADICQMLVVEKPIVTEENTTGQQGGPRSFDVKDFIWPHGLTPPLRHARKRRFRKRVNRATIEIVEHEVERLLAEDDAAEETNYELLENVNPDLSDSEYENEHIFDQATPGADQEGFDAEQGNQALGEDEDADEGGEDEDDEDDGFDAAFAAEIDQMDADRNDGPAGTSDGEEDGEERNLDQPVESGEDEDEEEDEDEDEDAIQARKLLNEEIKDLEAAIEKKVNDIASVQNALIKRRFEDTLKKLREDLNSRIAQRAEMQERKRIEDQAGITGEDGNFDELFGAEHEEDEDEDVGEDVQPTGADNAGGTNSRFEQLNSIVRDGMR